MKETNITLLELVYRIIGLYRSAHKSSDLIPSIRMIKDWIHSTRAMLLNQKFSLPFSVINDDIVQTVRQDYDGVLGPVKIEVVDTSLDPNFESDTYLMRTEIEIPPTIRNKGRIGCFTRIADADMVRSNIKLVSYETALVSGHGKFNTRDLYAFLREGRIYLTSRVVCPIDYLDIRGVFQNPEQIAGFSEKENYPISRDLIEAMENIIVTSKFPTTLVGYNDDVANEADNITHSPQKTQQ